MKTNPFCLKTRDACLFLHDDDDRRREDDDALQRVIDEARRLSPTARAALDWAEAHGVVFTVDRTCNARGYYIPQTGVVAMTYNTLREKNLARAIGTLTHEIRHAWQDYHGLLGNPDDDVLDEVRTTALFEADAYAFQMRAGAEAEYGLFKNRKPREFLPSFIPMFTARIEREMDLQLNFRQWFSKTARAEFYGDYVTDHQAERTLGEKAPDMGFESKMPKLAAGRKYLDMRDDADMRLMTTGFDGKAYVPAQVAPTLLRDLTEPTLSCRFFSATGSVSEKFAKVLEKQLDKDPLPPRLQRFLRPN